MKLIKRISHNTTKNGVSTDLDILIYEKSIIWYWAEQLQFHDGDEETEDQSYEEYIKNGPPPFAADLPAEKFKEIDLIVKRK